MNKLIAVMILLLPVLCIGQTPDTKAAKKKIGIKAGLNFSNITKAASINAQSRSGFMAGAFIALPSRGIMGYRSEIIFSKQGYDYKTGQTTGSVDLNYILLPQLMCINITKYVQLQAGGQLAFLVGGKIDSASLSSLPSFPSVPSLPFQKKMMDYYNKVDYGAAGGIEVYPFAGLLIGARYNISLGNLYKGDAGDPNPNFIPKVDVKNNVLQLFVGYKF
jgi:hypothetical protein